MLNRRRILIAEDEALVAFELALAVEQAGGEVVGPVDSVREGLELLANEEVHAAILDVRLVDRDIAPIAAILLEQGKAVVFHTASPVPDEIIARFGVPVVCSKPMQVGHVIIRLAALLGAGDFQPSEP
jgi:DNA-binding response OmpR family regulator